MSREIFNIEHFLAGQQCSPDAQDVDPDAAILSLDVDPESSQGELLGRFEDEWVTNPTEMYNLSNAAWLVRDNSLFDLVGHDELNHVISCATNFYDGTTPGRVLFQLDADHTDVQFATHAKDLRMAWGHESNTPPKWIGYVDHANLLGITPSGVQCEDAGLSSSYTVPRLHKIGVYKNGGSVFAIGIQYDGDTIYRINITSGTVETTDADAFKKLRGFCLDVDDADYFWVFSKRTTYGELTKVKRSDFTVANTIQLGTMDIADDCSITDIEATSGEIWLAAHKPSTTDPLHHTGFVFSISRTAADDTVPTVRTPRLYTSGAVGLGDWVEERHLFSFGGIDLGGTGTLRAAHQKIHETFPLSLSRVSTVEVAWAVRFTPSQTDLTADGHSGAGDWFWVGPTHLSTGLVQERADGVIAIIAESDAVNAPGRYLLTSAASPTGNQNFEGWVYRDTHTFYTCQGNTTKGMALTGTPDTVHVETPTFTSVASPQADRICSFESTNFRYHAIRLNGGNSIDIAQGGTWQWASEYDGGNVVITTAASTATPGFADNTTYFYGISLGYDNLQESPIVTAVATVDRVAADHHQVEVTVTVTDIGRLSSRVSSVNVYRASGALDATLPSEYYRIVRSIPLDDPFWVEVTANKYRYVFTDENSDSIGPSYEARTGCSETLETNMVTYQLCEPLNGQLFVGKCYHPNLADASHMLFKSLPFRYDTFNWIQDYLRLPFVPVALKAFGGRLFAFGPNSFVRIQPEGFYVEDTYEGYGVKDARSVLVTEMGIVFANEDSIYVFDGKNVVDFGKVIRTRADGQIYTWSWADMTHERFWPKIAFSRKHNLIIVVADYVPPQAMAFVYHIGFKRWDLWTMPSVEGPLGLFHGMDGEVYISGDDGNYRISTATSRHSFTWISKVLTMSTPTMPKKFQLVRLSKNSGTTDVTMSLDGGAYTTYTNNEITLAARKAKTLQIKIQGYSTTIVHSLGVIYRRLVGYR